MGKRVLSITVDEDVLTQWKEYVNKECINASQLVEKMLKEYLKQKGKNK